MRGGERRGRKRREKRTNEQLSLAHMPNSQSSTFSRRLFCSGTMTLQLSQDELHKAIVAIQMDATIDEAEKAARRQALLLGKWKEGDGTRARRFFPSFSPNPWHSIIHFFPQGYVVAGPYSSFSCIVHARRRSILKIKPKTINVQEETRGRRPKIYAWRRENWNDSSAGLPRPPLLSLSSVPAAGTRVRVLALGPLLSPG